MTRLWSCCPGRVRLARVKLFPRLVALASIATAGLVASVVQAEPQASEEEAQEVLGDMPVPLGDDADEARWCSPELETLREGFCYAEPRVLAEGQPPTLVVFLHGVVKPGTGWQWQQQRAAQRFARQHGFVALMPRGQRGVGPKGMEDWWTWPTGAPAQARIEEQVLTSIAQARGELEERLGRRFERVWVFGFSNGAYYATDLAMRGRLLSGALKADGFAVFAGGSAAEHTRRKAEQVASRTPLFVSWGLKDRDAPNQAKLSAMLRQLHWPTAAASSAKTGHEMPDSHVAAAVKFLRAQSGPVARPASKVKEKSAPPSAQRSRKKKSKR